MVSKGLTYKDAGVDYDPVDEFKRYAQVCAYATKGNAVRLGVVDVTASRGESAHLIELPDRYLAFVDEGLGTKNVATRRLAWGGKEYLWRHNAFDTVAMAVNDVITSGAAPVNASMHLQVAESDWFAFQPRWVELCTGWRAACDDARMIWGPGETPVLRDIIVPGECSLSCACVGQIFPKTRKVSGDVQPGHRILFAQSNGIHANGLTLARKIAERLPKRYDTPVPDTKLTYGEDILRPTRIYARLIEKLLDEGIRISYLVNVTGHGWRKLMRLEKAFTYVLERLPPEQPIFRMMQEAGKIETREMYQTFNMGAGFAIFVHPDDAEKAIALGFQTGDKLMDAGYVETGRKRVVISPLGLEFAGETMSIR